MKITSLFQRGLAYIGVALSSCALNTQAFTITLQEQGGLTGGINVGGGPVIINPVGTDHWSITVQDPRIGNAVGPTLSLAFTEPELVFGLTAYNNVQVLSFAPGIITFDVLSDEFSPYANIFPNSATAPLQNTDIEPVMLRFVDFADSVPEPGSISLLLVGAALLWRKRQGIHA